MAGFKLNLPTKNNGASANGAINSSGSGSVANIPTTVEPDLVEQKKFVFGQNKSTASGPIETPKTGFKLPGKETNAPAQAIDQSSAGIAGINAAQFQHATQPDVLAPATAEQFKANLGLLHTSFEHKEQVAGAIRRILTDLQDHPEYEEFLAPEDLGLMVRLLRQSYGNAVESAMARKKTKKSSAGVGVPDMSDMMNMLVS